MIGVSIMAERSDVFQPIDSFKISWPLLQQTVETLRREGRFEVESLLFGLDESREPQQPSHTLSFRKARESFSTPFK